MSRTVIVLREDSLVAASGKEGAIPKIQSVETIPMEGYGNPIDLWKEALIEYKKNHNPKEVKLILSSAVSTTRMMRVPFSRGRELAKMAQREVEENFGESIADYSIVQSDRKQGITLCCGGANANIIGEIHKISEEIDLPIKEISVPMEGYFRILDQVKAYRRQTAIYLFFEGSSVTSILYRNGVYHYSTRSRIFSEFGTIDFGTEIVRSISGIMQFYASSQAEAPITDVYYYGCSQDDFEVAVDRIQEMNLKVQKMNLEKTFSIKGEEDDWIPCIGGMIEDKKKRAMNLYKKWLDTQDEEITNFAIKEHIKIPAITLLVCIFLIAAMNVWNFFTTHQISEINDWINDPQIQQEYQAANKLRLELEALQDTVRQVNNMKTNLATYPDLTEDVIKEITDAGGKSMDIEVQNLDMETGTLGFNAVSKKVIDIPSYVQKLRQTGLFTTVDYTGYSYEENEYQLTLSCTLKPIETDEEN